MKLEIHCNDKINAVDFIGGSTGTQLRVNSYLFTCDDPYFQTIVYTFSRDNYEFFDGKDLPDPMYTTLLCLEACGLLRIKGDWHFTPTSLFAFLEPLLLRFIAPRQEVVSGT